jgi:hypothetical protein
VKDTPLASKITPLAPKSTRPAPKSTSHDGTKGKSSKRTRSKGKDILRLPSLRQASAQSFLFEEYNQLERDAQRQTILEYLRRDLQLSEVFKVSENLAGGLPIEEQGRRLLKLADEYQSQRTFKFNRFEGLCILNILNAQHNLTKLDEEIHFQKPWDPEVAKRVHEGIQIYILAIEAFQKLCFKTVGLSN